MCKEAFGGMAAKLPAGGDKPGVRPLEGAAAAPDSTASMDVIARRTDRQRASGVGISDVMRRLGGV